MKKVSSFCLGLFNVAFISIMLIILKIAIFNANIFKDLKPSLIMLGVVLGISTIALLAYLIRSVNNNKLILISFICLVLIILAEIFFVIYFRVNPSWDFGAVYFETLGNPDELSTYFYQLYPNNIGIGLLERLVINFCNIIGIQSYLKVLIMLNICVINISLIITYFFIRDLYGYKVSTIMSIIAVFFTPIYSYSTIVYTDTLTLIFPVAIFYLYYKSKDKRRQEIYMIIIGAITAIGVILKTNIVITLIALVIYIIFNSKPKEILKEILVILLVFLITMGGYKVYVQTLMPIPYSEAGYPFTHWIMMGLNGVGAYNSEDVSFTASFSTKEERKEANIKEIKNRLNNYGIKGYLEFLNKKLNFTWGDGTLYAPDKLRRQPVNENKFQKYIIGENNSIYIYISQISYVMIILLILIGAISNFKRRSREGYMFNICIFGVFLFLILWETRSRYLVCMITTFLMSASIGIDVIVNNKKLK